ncbi:hypothetical protein ID875_10190 [Streptomyces globisporus]|uniref:Uncharacterized protein n=1 Tax=Streptomyces globisporus TaxID=1908 RepID=A0A927BKQ9_STRGL|nr:hypothetical protein [Streptomyces globisporus]
MARRETGSRTGDSGGGSGSGGGGGGRRERRRARAREDRARQETLAATTAPADAPLVWGAGVGCRVLATLWLGQLVLLSPSRTERTSRGSPPWSGFCGCGR